MKVLKKLRVVSGMSQGELAKKVGVNYRTISSYETGARDMPVRVAKKVGKVLNIDWWILYEDRGGDFITNNIKVYRAYRNVSQKEKAEAIGITQQTLSRIETTNNTNLNTARKIADYFGVGIDDIFIGKNTIITCKK